MSTISQTVRTPDLRAATTPVTACRICGGTKFDTVIDLHDQCIGNAFHRGDDSTQQTAPLHLVRCEDCSLVQLAHRVDTELMYTSYWYRSGVNQTMRDHLFELVQRACEFGDLDPDDTVIDIGSNDGTTLKCYPEELRTIGVDPSNIEPEGCDVHINNYFSYEAVEEALQGEKAKIITSIAMFYDLNDPHTFVEDVRACLHDEGVWIVELSYLPTMLDAVSYDTICHEHVCYYRIVTFEQLLEGTGLQAFDVEMNGCNGGSFRLYIAREGKQSLTDRYKAQKARESRQLLDRHHSYTGFRTNVSRARSELRAFLQDAQTNGDTVFGYGASTKGMVTLQYCGVTPMQMPAIAERNPLKYGMFTPGTNIPIISEAEMRMARPNYLVVLPWHFIDEFRHREHEYLAAGGHLVVPMPNFEIYGADDD